MDDVRAPIAPQQMRLVDDLDFNRPTLPGQFRPLHFARSSASGPSSSGDVTSSIRSTLDGGQNSGSSFERFRFFASDTRIYFVFSSLVIFSNELYFSTSGNGARNI